MRYSITGTTDPIAITKQVKTAGGTNIRTFQGVPVTYAGLTDEQVEQLRAQGYNVFPSNKVAATVSIELPPEDEDEEGEVIEEHWELTPDEVEQLVGVPAPEDIPIQLPPTPPLYGEGVGVAIIDTGIRETHSQVQDRVVYSRNYTSDVMEDGFNHGTGVASLVVAVAPMCDLLNLKVMGTNGIGEEEDVIAAMDDCISLHDSRSPFAPRVLNLSFGAIDDGNPNNPIRVACREIVSRGMWVIAAAGNGGPFPGSITVPAVEKYVFGVGSVKYMGNGIFELSDWSSRGPTKEGLRKPDMTMFGEGLIVASGQSDTATITRSGTSFSAALCSGLAILYLEGRLKLAGYDPTQEEVGSYEVPPFPQEVIDQVLGRVCVKPAGVSAGKDNDYGSGLLYGPLVIRLLRDTAGAAEISIDLSSMVMMVVVMGMMGMMSKMVKTVK